jgi:flagellar biosynthesis/type III secretory pathway M-ring protein FliF/YscJ
VIDGIGLPQVGLGSGWALVAIFVVLIYRGALVPRRTYDDVAHDRDEWRAESRIKDAQNAEKDSQLAEKDKQLGHLAEVGRNTLAIMQSIKSLAERKP